MLVFVKQGLNRAHGCSSWVRVSAMLSFGCVSNQLLNLVFTSAFWQNMFPYLLPASNMGPIFVVFLMHHKKYSTNLLPLHLPTHWTCIKQEHLSAPRHLTLMGTSASLQGLSCDRVSDCFLPTDWDSACWVESSSSLLTGCKQGHIPSESGFWQHPCARFFLLGLEVWWTETSGDSHNGELHLS